MKKFSVLCLSMVLLSACSLTTPKEESVPVSEEPQQSATPSEYMVPTDTTHNLLITQQNFSVDEIIVTEGDDLILSVRNQYSEPINVTIPELRVISDTINPGEIARVEIPTNRPGEYELFSSLGTQRSDGFTATVIIEPAE